MFSSQAGTTIASTRVQRPCSPEVPNGNAVSGVPVSPDYVVSARYTDVNVGVDVGAGAVFPQSSRDLASVAPRRNAAAGSRDHQAPVPCSAIKVVEVQPASAIMTALGEGVAGHGKHSTSRE